MRSILNCALFGTFLGIQSNACLLAVDGTWSTTSTQDCVVLLHGLGRTGLSMKCVEWSLKQRDYHVVNITYPSLCVPMEQLANEYLEHALARRVPQQARRVNFVTHSMGGILLRQYLASHRVENLGRVVMLGTPNQGSKKADWFKKPALIRWLTGPNLSRLGTAPDDLPRSIGPADFEVGIVAGDRPWFGWCRTRKIPNDGTVTVDSTRLNGMEDFTIVHCSHTFMPNNRETLEQIGEFIQSGHFLHPDK